MELRKTAEILLRARISPLTSLFNPSSVSPWAREPRFCYQTANRHTQRAFSNTARANALRPEATTSATPSSGSNKTPDTVDTFPKGFWGSPSNKLSSSLSPDTEKRMNNGNSADDILRALGQFSKPGKFDASAMLDPSMAPLDNRSVMASYASGGHLAMPSAPRTPMRLTPSTGRTVTIGSGVDFARGLRQLEQSCARNKVRADATKQRFYERGGLKRKRLRRQRWRKRFLEGFQATVGRVRELKNQGW